MERVRLHFEIGSYFGGHDEFKWQRGKLRWRYATGPGTREPEKTCCPAPEAWVKFWSRVKSAGVWEWEADYFNADILDGTQWQLELEHDGCRVCSRGSNAYPGGAGPKSSFEQFRLALSDLAGEASQKNPPRKNR